MITKPFKRTYRPNKHPSSGYEVHSLYAIDGQRYIDSFKIIQKDLINLFDFVYPSDDNKSTYSIRIQDIYVRACIEVEANLNAILKENVYQKKEKGFWNIADFFKVDKTHFLSEYTVTIPHWEGKNQTITPFANWVNSPTLDWFKDYHGIKHDKYVNFRNANLLNAVTAVTANLILLSSQFNIFELTSVWQIYINDDSRTKLGLGGYFLVTFPEFVEDDMYNFDWNIIKDKPEPFQNLSF